MTDTSRPLSLIALLLAAGPLAAAAFAQCEEAHFFQTLPTGVDELGRAVEESGSDSVRLLGFCNQSKLPALYDLCDVFVLPSVYETWGLVINEAMNAAPGLILIESTEPGDQATAVTHGAGKDEVFVSRLRRDHTHPRGINMWVVADNVRKGAALNAVQILKMLVADQMQVET